MPTQLATHYLDRAELNHREDGTPIVYSSQPFIYQTACGLTQYSNRSVTRRRANVTCAKCLAKVDGRPYQRLALKISGPEALDRWIACAQRENGTTVHFHVYDLLSQHIVSPKQLVDWVAAHDDRAWLDGASNPVVLGCYRGRMRFILHRDGRYYTQFYCNVDLKRNTPGPL